MSSESLTTSTRASKAARYAGVAFTAMLCAGLLLRTPWLSRTIDLVIFLPAALYLISSISRFGGRARSTSYWLIVGGLIAYFFVLLLATVVIRVGVQDNLLRHIQATCLCLLTVIAVADTCRLDPEFACYLGRLVTIAAALAALILLIASLCDGALGQGRLSGVPRFNWVLNPNAVGGVYATCFAVAVGHALRKEIALFERAAALAIASLLLAVVLLTQSRGAMLGCLAAMLVASATLPRRLLIGGCGLILFAAAALAFVFPDWAGSLYSRGDAIRFALWAHFLELSQKRLWVGYGLDFDIVAIVDGFTVYTPHNILLAALVRGGVPGLLSLTTAIVGAVIAAISAARSGWSLPLVVLACSLSLGSVDHEVIPSSFSFYWYIFWLPIGLAAAGSRRVGMEGAANSISPGHSALHQSIR